MKTKLIISLILLIIAVGVVFMVKKPIKETMICLSNIETIEVLIEHMGPSDKPIFPIIFKYSDNAKSDSARLAKVKSERYEVGYVVLMGIDESKQILNIISSRLSLSKPEPEELAEFGTFSFQIYCN